MFEPTALDTCTNLWRYDRPWSVGELKILCQTLGVKVICKKNNLNCIYVWGVYSLETLRKQFPSWPWTLDPLTGIAISWTSEPRWILWVAGYRSRGF